MLLLAGGDADPQMLRLFKQASRRGIALHALLCGQSGIPCFNWDVKANRLLDEGLELKPRAAFIRQDVFTWLKSNKAEDQAVAREWYAAVAGWLLCNPEVKVFNRAFLGHGPVNKPSMLHLALHYGLEVADTFITNDGSRMDALALAQEWVCKPVTGGAHCQELTAAGYACALSYPQIVQRKLQQPELRVFRVGHEWFGFNVISAELDYRTSAATQVVQADVPADLREKMGMLCDRIGLDFAAADFKTDPASGRLQFLEINTSPMFVGFDQVANGRLCHAMLDWLVDVAFDSTSTGSAQRAQATDRPLFRG